MIRIPLVCLILTAFVLALAETGLSEEPARQFLQGLRARGYHDVAIDYLDSMAASGRGPEELLDVIQLEKAITLLASSRMESDQQARERQLDDAQQLLGEFIDQHKTHPQANEARTQLGNLIAERARLRVEASKKYGRDEEQLAEARRLYGTARQVFSDHLAGIRTELEQIPQVLDRQDDNQAELAKRRTQLRGDYVQTQLFLTAILEEVADTHPSGSEDRRKLLEEAAAGYDGIYKRYRTRLAGLYARMYQGRVNQELGNYREALGYYVELLDQPDSPEAFRILKTKTLRLAVDCWLHDSQNKYLEAIRRVGDWIATADPDDERDPDWLYLRLSLARAHLRQADEASANRRNSRIATASRNEAEKQAKLVARYESPFREEAHQLVADLGGLVAADNEPEVRNFDQARRAAKKLLDAMQPAEAKVVQLEQQLAGASELARPAIAAELEAARKSLDAVQQQAFAGFRLALRLADRETATDDVNLVRYMLTYLYYLRGDYYHAALLGDFVARHYPDGSTARKCAELALASYQLMYNRAASGDRTFETAQVIAAGERILNKWAAYPEGEKAAAALIPFMLQARRVERAREFLSYIPDQSPAKSGHALEVGMALWGSYLDQQKAAPGKDLSALRNDAHATLAAGIAGLPETAAADSKVAIAALCLAQTHTAAGQPREAISILTNPRYGPLTLVQQRHPAAQSSGFAEDTYQTTLRAQIASFSSPGDRQGVVAQTQNLMQEMAAAFGDSETGRRRLVTVYVGLAKELEEQLQVADPATKTAISSTFETLLARLSSGATDLSVLNWVAETFASLGAGFDTGGELNPRAAQYYEQSARALENLLARVDLDPALRVQIQFRLAGMRGKQRKYQEAMEVFQSLLSDAETSRNLLVQVAAADTLQRWADHSQTGQRSARYERAIQGDPRDSEGRRAVWGWGQIAKVTANLPKYVDSFHQARVNLTKCRIGLADSKQGAERLQLLKTAQRDISLTDRLYGLGDDQQRAEYDALMKTIQRGRGEPPVGLGAL